jgi:hypothetical protein
MDYSSFCPMSRLVLCTLLALSTGVIRASQGQGQAEAPAAAPKPLVPAATTSIVDAPDSFYGQSVTVTAAVDGILSPTSFTVDQDPAKSDRPLTVLAEILTAPVSINSYVTVIGEVVRHEGGPAIKATAVLTAKMIDIARRPPPPLTPEEDAFDKEMKRISAAFTAIRQSVAASGENGANRNAEVLNDAFGVVEEFWKKNEKPDAVKWAAEARQHARTLSDAVAALKWDEAKASVDALQRTCSACHGAYRQRLDDGSYRIRMGK